MHEQTILIHRHLAILEAQYPDLPIVSALTVTVAAAVLAKQPDIDRATLVRMAGQMNRLVQAPVQDETRVFAEIEQEISTWQAHSIDERTFHGLMQCLGYIAEIGRDDPDTFLQLFFGVLCEELEIDPRT